MDADTDQGVGRTANGGPGAPGDAASVHAEAAAQPPQEPGPRTGIVVGHDGSTDANHALTAWSIDTAPRPANWEFGYVSSYSDYAGAVTERLKKDVSAGLAAHPDVTVEYRVALGGAAKTLIEVSKGSRMLVVGSRGRGGLAGMLLGSVSEQCVRHADCPVLVVPPRAVHS
jgi:nucleotide-binding universal stress UspA family protein